MGKNDTVDVDGLRGYLKPGFDYAKEMLKSNGVSVEDLEDRSPIVGDPVSKLAMFID